ncbi:MAG: DUF4349 domain-containing protein [Lachnospiraceae bacterium]|nr:DUF4349 domain-containing protein [Lachnospiraceae bacterium]
MRKKIAVFALTLTMAFLTTACGSDSSASDYFVGANKGGATQNGVMADSGSGNYDYNDYDEDYSYEYGYAESDSWNVESTANNDTQQGQDGTLTGEKLVYTCELSIETLEYEQCVNAIKNNISAFGGIIERESESDSARNWYYGDYVKTTGTRRLNMTVRIPSGKYYEFLASLEGTGKIVSKNSYVENISRRYYETDALIQSLEIQQQRLLDMMEQAETIEDMLIIESRLSEVQYQLNSARNSLSSMDTDVAFSTVTVLVDEVMEYTPQEPVVKTNTFWDRLQNTLSETWEFTLEMLEFLLFMVIRLIPVAVFIAVVVLIVLFCIKQGQKKARRKAKPGPVNSGPQFRPQQAGWQPQFGPQRTGQQADSGQFPHPGMSSAVGEQGGAAPINNENQKTPE